VPAFCRHNRLIANCPICTREQGTKMNPVVSSSTPRVSAPRERVASSPANRLGEDVKPRRSSGGRSGGMKVRKLERGVDDGYASGLVQGLRSSAEVERLAEEIAFAVQRLVVISTQTPAAFSAIVDPDSNLEERTWAAVQFELDPDAETVSWASGDGADSYRAWAERAGSQQTAFTGEAYWTAERRFERIFERLGSLGGGFDRDARFDLLVLLGRLGLYELEAGKLFPSGENETTWAAKRALGIGDPLLLERRAADLASACGVPLAALDLGFHNWNVGAARRTGRGVADDLQPDPDVLAAVRGALGV
jgi:hypothetical protein